MPKRIQRPFCTIYKRSESEKRAWNAAKEVEAQKHEIEELKKQIEELKGVIGVSDTEEDTKESSTGRRKSKKTD